MRALQAALLVLLSHLYVLFTFTSIALSWHS
jgi:hypothetical protein